ncbi:MAG: DUF1559 domain-containing protein [Pirellulales bacterium]|nr:DUF1559 domain-containing protein [Pirellulales bacterium]
MSILRKSSRGKQMFRAASLALGLVAAGGWRPPIIHAQIASQPEVAVAPGNTTVASGDLTVNAGSMATPAPTVAVLAGPSPGVPPTLSAAPMPAQPTATPPAAPHTPVILLQSDTQPVPVLLAPSALPVPALKVRLLPQESELLPGDAAAYYTKAIVFLNSHGGKDVGESQSRISDWLELPLEKFPLAAAKQELGKYRSVINYLHYGAVRRECHWAIPIHDGRENPIAILLPEIQEMRNCAKILALQARVDILENRPVAALDSLRSGYALGRKLGESPILINSLVGMAITHIMNRELLNLLSVPECPNLYWTITALPTPLIDTRPTIDFEMNILFHIFPEMAKLDKEEHAPEEWNRLYGTLVVRLQSLGREIGVDMPASLGNDVSTAFLGTLALPVVGQRAKEMLPELGYDKSEIAKMSFAQAFLTQLVAQYKQTRDEMLKLQFLPIQEFAKLGYSDKEAIEQARRREIIPLAQLLLPAVTQARFSAIRLERAMALMRAIEALRLHAQQQQSLPKSWSEVAAVPVPLDPLTGQPFTYVYHGQTAVIEALSPAGRPGQDLRYKLSLATPEQIATRTALVAANQPAGASITPSVAEVKPATPASPSNAAATAEKPAATPLTGPAVAGKLKYHETDSSWNPIVQARAAARRSQSLNNMKQLGLAMHNYQDAHKTFPSPGSVDKNGKPLLSWRVHLLPYIEQDALYRQFKLDEPWDSEHNKKLIEKMPQLYASPLSQPLPAGKTCYQLPVGPDTMFSQVGSGPQMRDITDGTSNTILLLEVSPDRAVEWTKPADWEYDAAGKEPLAGLFGMRQGGLLTLFADASARVIAPTIDAAVLQKLLTSRGGEPIEDLP